MRIFFWFAKLECFQSKSMLDAYKKFSCIGTRLKKSLGLTDGRSLASLLIGDLRPQFQFIIFYPPHRSLAFHHGKIAVQARHNNMFFSAGAPFQGLAVQPAMGHTLCSPRFSRSAFSTTSLKRLERSLRPSSVSCQQALHRQYFSRNFLQWHALCGRCEACSRQCRMHSLE